ncbi:TPA: hypothetical protein EYP44_02475 [Candidatus Bathyarchaeota archaeon]|nr:hypothetical protein [Candidatus Bathyarchaeota archaeon]
MRGVLKRMARSLSASQLLEEALLIGISLCIAATIFALISKVSGQLGSSIGQVWDNIVRMLNDYFSWLSLS